MTCGVQSAIPFELQLFMWALIDEMPEPKDSFQIFRLTVNNGKQHVYDDLRNIQLIRAKTFELFEFYAQYISYDKKNIKDFITSSYNLCEYYKKIWIKADITNNKQLKNIIKLFVEAQNLLFY